MDISNKVKLEWLILADAARILNNKVDLRGAGWNAIGLSAFPAQLGFPAVIAFDVPWALLSLEHVFQLEITDQDGQVLRAGEVRFEGQKPEGSLLGQAQRVHSVLPIELVIPKPGTYVITVRNASEVYGRVVFNVVDSTASFWEGSAA